MSGALPYRVFVRHDREPPEVRRHIVRNVNIDIRSRPDGVGYFVTLYSDGTSSVSSTTEPGEMPAGKRREALIAAALNQDVEPYPDARS